MKTIKLTDKKGLTNTFEFDEMPQITIDGEVVVFESKKEEFKKGDICFTYNLACQMVYIYESDNGVFDINYIALFILDNNELRFNDYLCAENGGKKNQSLATSEQSKLFFDALAKKGKQWNAEKLCIEDLKVEPKAGDLVKLRRGIGKDFAYAKIKSIDEKNYYYESRLIDDMIHNNKGGWYISDNTTIEILTPDQFQSEVNALGFEYDFENDTYSVLKWKPKDNDLYYYFNTTLNVCNIHYLRISSIDFLRFLNGNCFKTESECQEKIEQIKAILK